MHAKLLDDSSRVSGHLRWPFWLVATITSLVLALPLLATPYLTLFDYPNHVARYCMLARDQQTDFFQNFFEVNDKFIPNLGFDFLTVNLAKVIPAPLAAQIIIFVSVFMSALGLCYLARKIQGQGSWLSCLPAVFLWGFSLVFGFNNYILAFAFFPWALLTFLRFLDTGRFGPMAFYVVLVGVSFLCHAQVAAITIFFALAFCVAYPGRGAKGLLAAVSPALVIVPMLAMSPSSGEFSRISLGGVKHKLRIFTQAFLTGNTKADLVFVAMVVAATAYLAFSKQVKSSRMLIVLGSASLLLTILFPSNLKIAANLDARIIPIGLSIVFCCLQPPRALTKVATFAIIGLLGFRSAAMFLHLRSGGNVAKAALEAMGKLPDNAIVFNVVSGGQNAFRMQGWNPPVLNLPYLELWRRPIYISGLYSYPNQQPMIYSEGGRKLEYLGIVEDGAPVMSPSEELKVHLRQIRERMKMAPQEFWLRHEPYIFLGLSGGDMPPLPKDLVVTAQGPKFAILKIGGS